MTLLANLLNIGFVIIAEAYIVEKANKCLDFTLTIFIIHLFIIWYNYKIPNTFYWWASQGAIVTLTVLASEFFCLKLETAEIKLSVGHILERGKELGKEAAQLGKEAAHKIIKAEKSNTNGSRRGTKDSKKQKRKEKTEEV